MSHAACVRQDELDNTVEASAEELTNQDEKIANLQNQVIKLKQTNQNLQRDLTLTQRLAESRKIPYFENEFNQGLTASTELGPRPASPPPKPEFAHVAGRPSQENHCLRWEAG